MHTYDLILPFFLAVIAITSWNIGHCLHRLSNTLTGSDGKWCFKDWSAPLVSMTAGLSLILAFAQQNKLISAVSLLCGGLVLVLPLAYNTLCEPARRAWTFLLFAVVMLLTIGLELIVAAAAADDSIVTGVPPIAVTAFRVLMIVAAAIVLHYYGKSSAQLLDEQNSPKEHRNPIKTLITAVCRNMGKMIAILSKFLQPEKLRHASQVASTTAPVAPINPPEVATGS